VALMVSGSGRRDGLNRSGVAVVGEARDGREALQIVERAHPDVVLMDIAMPGMDGVEATRTITATHPNLPVLILTSSEEDTDLFAAIQAGASGYVTKDFNPTALVESIGRAIRGEPALSPSDTARLLAEFRRISDGTPPEGLAHYGRAGTLTRREREVLEHVEVGATDSEIADRLYIAHSTVRFHMRNILRKLQVQNRTEAIRYARYYRQRPLR
jgi:DNA-binding NarL/FixJ family response regulator